MRIATKFKRRERLFRCRPFIETSGRRDYGVDMALRMNREILMVMVQNHFVFATSRAWLECYLQRAVPYGNVRITRYKPESMPIKTMALTEFLRGTRC